MLRTPPGGHGGLHLWLAEQARAIASGAVRMAPPALVTGMRRSFVAAARATYRHRLDLIAYRAELGEVLNRRGLLGTGVEVGVKDGAFSEHLLEHWRGRLLISIDAWSAVLDPALSQAEHDALQARAASHLARFGARSEIRRGESVTAASLMAPRGLDFVYIDAAHDYESVAADLVAWAGCVRPGGLLMGHDYYDGLRHGHAYGVRRAVREFCHARGLPHAVTLFDHPEASWLVVVPA